MKFPSLKPDEIRSDLLSKAPPLSLYWIGVYAGLTCRVRRRDEVGPGLAILEGTSPPEIIPAGGQSGCYVSCANRLRVTLQSAPEEDTGSDYPFGSIGVSESGMMLLFKVGGSMGEKLIYLDLTTGDTHMDLELDQFFWVRDWTLELLPDSGSQPVPVWSRKPT